MRQHDPGRIIGSLVAAVAVAIFAAACGASDTAMSTGSTGTSRATATSTLPSVTTSSSSEESLTARAAFLCAADATRSHGAVAAAFPSTVAGLGRYVVIPGDPGGDPKEPAAWQVPLFYGRPLNDFAVVCYLDNLPVEPTPLLPDGSRPPRYTPPTNRLDLIRSDGQSTWEEASDHQVPEPP